MTSPKPKMSEVTNADLLNVLLEMKGDIGGLKSSTGLMLEGLKNHSGRLGAVEDSVAKQKGANKAWAVASTVGGSVFGAILAALVPGWLKH